MISSSPCILNIECPRRPHSRLRTELVRLHTLCELVRRNTFGQMFFQSVFFFLPRSRCSRAQSVFESLAFAQRADTLQESRVPTRRSPRRLSLFGRSETNRLFFLSLSLSRTEPHNPDLCFRHRRRHASDPLFPPLCRSRNDPKFLRSLQSVQARRGRYHVLLVVVCRSTDEIGGRDGRRVRGRRDV